jgi:hypothetical protein
MGERNRESDISEPLEDTFEPALSDLMDEEFEDLMPASSQKQCLAKKRRKAEQRLEERRLQDELGYYDIDLDNY